MRTGGKRVLLLFIVFTAFAMALSTCTVPKKYRFAWRSISHDHVQTIVDSIAAPIGENIYLIIEDADNVFISCSEVGFITVSAGLLSRMRSEAMLAGAIAREIAFYKNSKFATNDELDKMANNGGETAKLLADELKAINKLRSEWGKEFKRNFPAVQAASDRDAVFIMALAGYRPEGLLEFLEFMDIETWPEGWGKRMADIRHSIVQANHNAQDFDVATKYLSDGYFEAAISKFQDILTKYKSAFVYQNLAVSYYYQYLKEIGRFEFDKMTFGYSSCLAGCGVAAPGFYKEDGRFVRKSAGFDRDTKAYLQSAHNYLMLARAINPDHPSLLFLAGQIALEESGTTSSENADAMINRMAALLQKGAVPAESRACVEHNIAVLRHRRNRNDGEVQTLVSPFQC